MEFTPSSARPAFIPGSTMKRLPQGPKAKSYQFHFPVHLGSVGFECECRGKNSEFLHESHQDFLHYLAFHIGQAEITTAVAVGELLVIEPQEMQHGVVDVDFSIDALGFVVVAFAVTVAGLHAAASQPDREGSVVVVAAVALGGARATKLGAKDDERFVEQAGDGFIRSGAFGWREVLDVVMMVPVVDADLNVANADLGEFACEETMAAEAIGGGLADAVEV